VRRPCCRYEAAISYHGNSTASMLPSHDSNRFWRLGQGPRKDSSRRRTAPASHGHKVIFSRRECAASRFQTGREAAGKKDLGNRDGGLGEFGRDSVVRGLPGSNMSLSFVGAHVFDCGPDPYTSTPLSRGGVIYRVQRLPISAPRGDAAAWVVHVTRRQARAQCYRRQAWRPEGTKRVETRGRWH
jgi:hypothetical protein